MQEFLRTVVCVKTGGFSTRLTQDTAAGPTSRPRLIPAGLVEGALQCRETLEADSLGLEDCRINQINSGTPSIRFPAALLASTVL